MIENPEQKKSRPRLSVLTTCWLLTALALGCRSDAEWQPSEKHKIIEVIASISDAGSDQEKLAQVFSVIPDEAWLNESQTVSFVVDEIDIRGDSASVQVSIENHFGEQLQQVTWTCQRSGGKWQVAEAPLK